jgi:holo-[acyl-carrier protein] synthase
MRWLDAEIVNETTGDPRFDIRGSVQARADELGVASVHVSLSHDAGIASAVVVLES